MIAANNMIGKRKLSFSVVRYGNVMGSRGSVIPKFIKQKKEKLITITHKDMTRFNITLKESIDMVDWAISKSVGGEIIIPKIPSFKVTDLAQVIAPKAKVKYIGLRQGEKIHEDLITVSESINTLDYKKYLIIQYRKKIQKFYKKKGATQVSKNFNYNSGTNSKFLNRTEIKSLLKKNKLIDKIENNYWHS